MTDTKMACVKRDLQPIPLPSPRKDGGKTVLASLWKRKSTRAMREERLAPQVLADLLWATFGVNQETGPIGKVGRTAPSGMNLQAIDVYVAFPEGVYFYEAAPHRLTPILAQDVRAMTNRRPAAATAPTVLIYVVSTDVEIGPPPGGPLPGGPPPGRSLMTKLPCFGEVEAGFIGQNVYLFCASQGLATWFFAPDREALAKAMDLRSTQTVLYCQAVGYPE